MSMVLTDETVPTAVDASGLEPDGIVVNLFRPGLASFPSVETLGRDIVQLRHVRIQQYQAKLQAISAKWSAWTVFRRDDSGKWTCHPARDIAETEVEELDLLEAAMATKGLAEPAGVSLDYDEAERPSYKKRPRCLQTIAQLEPNTFFDFVGEVESLGDSSTGSIIYYFRDYSTDQNLSITFWDNFRAEAEEKLEIGSLVYLTNIHAREVNDRIVGSMHGDSSAIRGSHIKLLNRNSPLVQALLRRREREEEHEAADKQQEDFSLRHIVLSKSRHPSRQGPMTKIDWTGVPVTPISTVLACPKKNFKFCIKAKVQSIRPDSVLEWSRPACKTCDRSWKAGDKTQCPYCGDPWDGRYTWVFFVDCSDSTGTIELIVCFDDATHFLAGLQPVDVSTSVEVKEKLEGVRQAVLDSQSETKFCISSYEVSGIRRYRISDTQINF